MKILIAIIVLIVSVVLFLKSSNIVEDVLVSYNTDSNIDYKVFIFENDYIKEKYMEQGKTYITDLVDNIDLTFNYKLSSSKKLESSYKYTVVANVFAKYKTTGQELWKEEIPLVEEQELLASDEKNMDISINTKLPFKTINDKVENFKVKFNIPITAYVDVALKIVDTQTGEEIDTTGISADLNEDVFEIKGNKLGHNVKENKTKSCQR